MIRGLYTAATAMITQQERLSVTSNNLANVNTNGFKEDQAALYEFPTMLMNEISNDGRYGIGTVGRGAGIYGTYTRYGQGQIRQTGNPLDLAIDGNGFFAVQTPNGRAYTRDGSFSLNAAGQLVTKQGYAVLDANGNPIIVGNGGGRISVSQDGIVQNNGAAVGTVGLFDLGAQENIRKEGDNLYITGNAAVAAAGSRIMGGCLEGSNVSTVREMIEMIETMRAFESCQRAILAQDATLERAVNNVGRL